MRKALFTCLWILAIALLHAQRVEPKEYLVYEDKAGTLTVNDIKHRTDFKPVKTLNFGYTESAIWIKVPLKDYYNGEPYCVVARHPTVWEIDFYELENDSVVSERLMGISRPKRNHELLMDRYFMEVTPENTRQVVYIRMKEVSASMHNTIFFQQKWNMHREATVAAMLYYVSAGAVLVLLIYALFKFVTIRKRIFLYYGAWIAGLIFFLWIQVEYAFHFLPEAWIGVTHQLRFFMLIPLLVFWLLFTKHVLALHETGTVFNQRAYYILLRLYPVFLLFIFFNTMLPPNIRQIIIALFYAIIVFTFVVVIYTAVLSARNGHRPAKYFLVGQVPFVLAYSIFLVRNFGFIPNSELTLFVPTLCLLFEMGVMFICMERHFHFEHVIERAVAVKQPEQTVLETLVHETIETTGKEEIGAELLNLFERIKAYFNTEKVYLNVELKLSDVADKLNVPAYQISKCINSCSNMHFFDFVNSYRVEAAKALIKTEEINQKYTIEYVAAKSGFNSKSTFNTAFKKFTGMTPSQYRTTPAGA